MAASVRIFVSYREDTAGHAGRLHDALASRFGEAGADVDATSCDVLVALIGRGWSSALDDPRDKVRVGIATALERGILVIPVLVQGAQPPADDQLPAAIAGLARRNALELSDARWRYDVGRLLEAIEEGAEGDEGFPASELPEIRLPTPATPFVGREREVAEVTELLRQQEAHLVTLTGPGGIGKTRLALEAARQVVWRFPDGITWVPLATLHDASLVLSGVAQALSVKEEPGRPLGETLAGELAGKRALLVPDNAEQLLPGFAAEASSLLADCPSVALLVTSRERLQVAGEHVYPVPPLSEDGGVALFCQRAGALDPGFEESPAVAELCRRLDRLPLALELAAARTPLFSVEQLLERLSERLDLLKGERGADPRQQTLRATIAWSYDLLDDEERLLFERLSVFSNGCTLDAAERVCAADPDPLQSLLDKNLVRRRRDGSREPRFWMLETIRQFAEERLEASGDDAELRGRHAEYFLDLAEKADAEVRAGHDQAAWLGRAQDEQDNLRTALRRLARVDETEPELRLATALGRVWDVQGHFSEAERCLEAALDRSPEHESPLRARALERAGLVAYDRGDFERARARLEESVAVARRLGEVRAASSALANLGVVATSEGELDHATSLHEETLALFRELGDERAIGITIGNLGYVELLRGNHGRAGELFGEAIALLRAVGDEVSLVMMLANLAFVAIEEGDGRRAGEAAREGVELAAGLGYREGVWSSLVGLAATEEDPERAARLLGAAEALCEADGGALQPVERAVYERTAGALRERLGDAGFRSSSDNGAGLGLDAAVTYALSGEER